METTVKDLNNFGFIPQNNLNSYAPVQKQMYIYIYIYIYIYTYIHMQVLCNC